MVYPIMGQKEIPEQHRNTTETLPKQA